MKNFNKEDKYTTEDVILTVLAIMLLISYIALMIYWCTCGATFGVVFMNCLFIALGVSGASVHENNL